MGPEAWFHFVQSVEKTMKAQRGKQWDVTASHRVSMLLIQNQVDLRGWADGLSET